MFINLKCLLNSNFSSKISIYLKCSKIKSLNLIFKLSGLQKMSVLFLSIAVHLNVVIKKTRHKK